VVFGHLAAGKPSRIDERLVARIDDAGCGQE